MRTTASKDDIEAVFHDVEYIDAGIAGETGFVTLKMSESDYEEKAGQLGNIISRIRIEG